MRGGNQLLKSPTFIPRSFEGGPRTTNQRHNSEFGLLSKPKLEVGQAQWGGSKVQPTLTSKDFLSKTKFATGLGLSQWTGGIGSGSPAQNGLLHSSSPAHSPLNRTNNLTASGSDTSSHTSQDFLSNSKMLPTSSLLDQSKFSAGKLPLANGLLNGAILKNSNQPFPTAPKFGVSPFSRFGAPSTLSNNHINPMGAIKRPSNMSSLASNKFGGFGSNSFGTGLPLRMSATSMLNMAASGTKYGRNGEVKHEPIFGSKEKVRNTVAKSDSHSRFNAFERYADGGGTKSANPFADAMRRAKNPSPHQYSDSDCLTEDESSSYYSGSDYSQDSGVSGSSDEDSVISDIDDISKSLPPSVTNGNHLAEVRPGVPATPCDIPLQWNMPPLYVTNNLPGSSQAMPPPYSSPVQSSGHTKSANSAMLPSPDKSNNLADGVATNVTGTLPGIPPATALDLQPKQNSLVSADEEMPTESHLSKHPSSQTVEKSASPRMELSHLDHHHQLNNSQVKTDVVQLNGNVQTSEVSGNIDLDTPSLTLSIPSLLLSQASGPNKSRKKRRASRRSSSSRTPNRPTCQTPVHGSKTPSYSFNTTDYPCPATPVFTPNKANNQVKNQTVTISSQGTKKTAHGPSRARAPTKPEALEKMRKQGLLPPVKRSRAKIGPKSYMHRVNGRVLTDSEDELTKSMFHKSEMQPRLSARADNSAPYQSRFKQNQTYLLFLRRRALDLVLSLFPDIRVGGNFCFESDDVDGLLDYITMCLEHKDSSRRCMDSMHSSRNDLQVSICSSSKKTVRQLNTRLCRLIRLVLPSLTLSQLEKQGVKTMSALIHKIIIENS